jgi:hypothetical protein
MKTDLGRACVAAKLASNDPWVRCAAIMLWLAESRRRSSREDWAKWAMYHATCSDLNETQAFLCHEVAEAFYTIAREMKNA